MEQIYNWDNPHPSRCETCRKDIMYGDSSCPIFREAPQTMRQNYNVCGQAAVVTTYIGCMKWADKTSR